MSDAPFCPRCEGHHWRFHRCPAKPALMVVHRPREGFLDFGDRLDQETIRMGETTFARQREPGERPGSLRAPQMGEHHA